MPTTLPPQHRPIDLAEMRNRLESLWSDLSGEIRNHADDPKAQSLLQTGADVVAGLAMAFQIHLERYSKATGETGGD